MCNIFGARTQVTVWTLRRLRLRCDRCRRRCHRHWAKWWILQMVFHQQKLRIYALLIICTLALYIYIIHYVFVCFALHFRSLFTCRSFFSARFVMWLSRRQPLEPKLKVLAVVVVLLCNKIYSDWRPRSYQHYRFVLFRKKKRLITTTTIPTIRRKIINTKQMPPNVLLNYKFCFPSTRFQLRNSKAT